LDSQQWHKLLELDSTGARQASLAPTLKQ
jgi:hypothetical protein